jgi:hypothetical protein
MTHAPTGTGPTRRRLTLEEAQRGASPDGFTPAEWHALHMASAQETRDKHYRLCAEYNRLQWGGEFDE